MKLEIERIEKGIAVQYADASLSLASRGSEILISRDAGIQWHHLLTLPGGTKLGRTATDIVERLTRGGVRLIKHIEGDTFLCLFEGSFFRFNTQTSDSQRLWTLARGRRILRNGVCVLGSTILVGDYWTNGRREDVRVHTIDLATGVATRFLTIPTPTVRHVHLVQTDPFSDRIWIGTGDEDHECLVLRVDPSNPRLQTVGGGSQRWRCITLVFTQDAVYWGSDNHTGSNAIFRYGRAARTVDVIGPVIGPVYYAVKRGGNTVFGTTVEKGEGDQDGWGRLYVLDGNETITEVFKAQKDLWPIRLFGYAIHEFADGPEETDTFWVIMRGFRGGLRSMLCRIID